MRVQVEITAGPDAERLREVVSHPLVTAIRWNTIMPSLDGPGAAFDRLNRLGLPVWADLKGRQLRVVEAAVPPWTSLRLSHPLTVTTPCNAYLAAGREHARVVQADGDRIVVDPGPRRVVGPGESINIVDPSLRITGTLTSSDRQVIELLAERRERRVLLSWVESAEDVQEVKGLLSGAEVRCKIESNRGLEYVRRHGNTHGSLVAARGDLYVQVGRPHRLPTAVREILRSDPEATVASRLGESFLRHPVPSSADVSDIALLLEWGARRFLLGDEVCLHHEALVATLELIRALAAERT